MKEHDRIKGMYEAIKAPEKAVDRLLEIPESKKTGRQRRTVIWKLAAVFLLAAIIIPTGALAVGKITRSFYNQTKKGKYQVNVDIKKAKEKEQKYVKVSCHFGKDYILDKADEEGGDQSYYYKDGFDAGKDFWYRLIRIDTDKKESLPAYDVGVLKKKKIGNHRTIYYKTNGIVGSRYAKADEATTYNQHLYIFFDEYGYMLEVIGMQNLGEKGMYALGRKFSMQETSKKKADSYILLSRYFDSPTADHIPLPQSKPRKITGSVWEMDKKVVDELEGCTFRVTDVKVTDSVKGMDKKAFAEYASVKSLWNRHGKLKSYEREKLKFGDGIKNPECQVIGREKVQLKLVQVTMKVKNVKGISDLLGLPDLHFLEKKKGKYYVSDCYEKGERPANIEEAFIDRVPFYFEETKGGSSFRLIENFKKGEERTLHFAFLVDEDMTDRMYLCVAGWSNDTEQYVKLEID